MSVVCTAIAFRAAPHSIFAGSDLIGYERIFPSCMLPGPEGRILRFAATRALGGIATGVHPAFRTWRHLDPAAPGEFSLLFANLGRFHRFLEETISKVAGPAQQ
jgi:hypothetical protein